MLNIGISRNLIYTILVYSFFNITIQVQLFVFSTIPQVFHEMHNHTLFEHYGIEPTETNISLINTLMSFASGSVFIYSILYIIPLAESRGRKYVCVHIRFLVAFSSSLLLLASYYFKASEFFVTSQVVISALVPLNMINFLYIGECAPDSRRGFATTSLAICDVITQVFMFSTSSPQLLGTSSTWWPYILISIIGAIGFYIATYKLPDSPKWLITAGRYEEARASIEFYHGTQYKTETTFVSLIKENNLTENQEISFKKIWNDETLKEALKLIIVYQIFLSSSPIPVERVYTVTLETSFGLTTQESLNFNLIIALIFFPARFLGPSLLDSIGRRPVIFFAATIMYLKVWIMFLNQYVVYLFGASTLTKIFVYVSESLSEIFSASGVVPIATVFVAELFPPTTRIVVTQVVMFTGIISAFPMGSLYPLINTIYPPGYYLPLILIQPICIFYLFRNLPETKARAVYDIVDSFDNAVSSRHASIHDEKTPILRKRSNTMISRQRKILAYNSKERANSVDQKYLLI